MAFKDEERSSGIISVPDIMRKASDENFNSLAEQIKKFTPEERVNAGRNIVAQLLLHFMKIWDDDMSALATAIAAFTNYATQIGCAGLDSVSDKRKAEVASYFQDMESLSDTILQRDDFFDYSKLSDIGYRALVEIFLCASLEPLAPAGAEYTTTLFNYMLLVACADSVNEQGIKAIRKLRSDYFDYAPRKKNGEVEKFLGSFDKTMFKKSADGQRVGPNAGPRRESPKHENAGKNKDSRQKKPSGKKAGSKPQSSHSAPEAPKKTETTEQRRDTSIDEQKAAAAREEAERKKRQELKQSAAVIRKTLLEQLRQRVEAEKEAASAKIGRAKQHLAQVTQAERSKQEEELASVQAEFDSVSSALSSMGLFQLKQKSDAKAKLQQLRIQIEHIKQLCQTPESEEIRQAETAVEQAEEELEGCDTKQEKWETAVESACDLYEQRVNLHLDYISGKELHLKSKLSKTELEEYDIMISANVFAFHSTLQEIIENSFVLRQLGTVKAAGIIGKMVAKGYLSRTVTNGKTYFDFKEVIPDLIDDIGWDITKPPIAPDLDSIISETNT